MRLSSTPFFLIRGKMLYTSIYFITGGQISKGKFSKAVSLTTTCCISQSKCITKPQQLSSLIFCFIFSSSMKFQSSSRPLLQRRILVQYKDYFDKCLQNTSWFSDMSQQAFHFLFLLHSFFLLLLLLYQYQYRSCWSGSFPKTVGDGGDVFLPALPVHFTILQTSF